MNDKPFYIIMAVLLLAILSAFIYHGEQSVKLAEYHAARVVANAALNDLWQAELDLAQCKGELRDAQASFYTFIDRED